MKPSIRISVKEPCTNNFNTFEKTARGGFCQDCQKEVIDFTHMSKMALNAYLSTAPVPICGRFRTSQLQPYTSVDSMWHQRKSIGKLVGFMGLSLLALCHAPKVLAQTADQDQIALNWAEKPIALKTLSPYTVAEDHTVMGIVLDEENVPLPGVNVILKGTKTGTTTDYDGKFEFPTKLNAGDVLIFSYLGYGTKEYSVPESDSEVLNITIQFNYADVELMGAVEVEGVYASKKNIFQKIKGLFKK